MNYNWEPDGVRDVRSRYAMGLLPVILNSLPNSDEWRESSLVIAMIASLVVNEREEPPPAFIALPIETAV